jgi:cobalt/nickel transport system permease protein
MTYRYLSTLLAEATSMFTAYSLRSPGQCGVKIKDIGSFLGQLILRSFDHAENVYQAMECRGFQGVYYRKMRGAFRASDFLYIVVLLSIILILRLSNLILFFGRLVR